MCDVDLRVATRLSRSHNGSPIKWSHRSDIEIFFDWAMSFFQRWFESREKKQSVKWVKLVTLNLLGYHNGDYLCQLIINSF